MDYYKAGLTLVFTTNAGREYKLNCPDDVPKSHFIMIAKLLEATGRVSQVKVIKGIVKNNQVTALYVYVAGKDIETHEIAVNIANEVLSNEE